MTCHSKPRQNDIVFVTSLVVKGTTSSFILFESMTRLFNEKREPKKIEEFRIDGV